MRSLAIGRSATMAARSAWRALHLIVFFNQHRVDDQGIGPTSASAAEGQAHDLLNLAVHPVLDVRAGVSAVAPGFGVDQGSHGRIVA